MLPIPQLKRRNSLKALGRVFADKQLEAGAAARMGGTVALHAGHCKRHPGLVGIHRLVFCAVIGKHPLDIRQHRYHLEVSDEYGKPDEAFYQVEYQRRADIGVKQLGEKQGNQEEQGNSKSQSPQNREPKQSPRYSPSLLFFLQGDICRVHQGANP